MSKIKQGLFVILIGMEQNKEKYEDLIIFH